MVTMAQRMEQLRAERGVSRPALAAALGFPRMAVEKFETGRQTPTQEQQEKMASYFGVSLPYLRGENNDRTQADDWMDGAFLDTEPAPAPVEPVRREKSAAGEGGAVFDALLSGEKFRKSLREAVMEVLRSPEGQELVKKAVRGELESRKQRPQ